MPSCTHCTSKNPHWCTHTHTQSITLACIERLFMCIMSTNTLRVNVSACVCVCVCWHWQRVTFVTFFSSNHPCINQSPDLSPALHLSLLVSRKWQINFKISTYWSITAILANHRWPGRTQERADVTLTKVNQRVVCMSCVVEEAKKSMWGHRAYMS